MLYNLHNGIRPVDQADSIAMLHDIDYLTNKEPIISDAKAITRAFAQGGVTLSNLALIAGLSARSALDVLLHKSSLPNVTHINGDWEPSTNRSNLQSAESLASLLAVADLSGQRLGFH